MAGGHLPAPKPPSVAPFDQRGADPNPNPNPNPNEALREAAIAAGLPPSARPPLAPRGGEPGAAGVAAGGGKQEAPQRTAWLREQLSARLALPCVSGEIHLDSGEIEPGAATAASAGGGGGGSGASCGGGRLRAPQRAAVLRKVLSLLGPGPVLLLCEAPLAVLQACAPCTPCRATAVHISHQ